MIGPVKCYKVDSWKLASRVDLPLKEGYWCNLTRQPRFGITSGKGVVEKGSGANANANVIEIETYRGIISHDYAST